MPHRLINISEATAIALHAAVLLANRDEPASAAAIAAELGVSKHHLSKILRLLVIRNRIASSKGPRGGFFLTERQKRATFMQIMEAVEGKVRPAECLFGRRPCARKPCILGGLLCRMNAAFEEYFNNTSLMNFKEEK